MSDPYNPFSSDPANPYASPQVAMVAAPGVRWLQEPSPSLRQTGLGLSLVYYGIITMLICSLLILFFTVAGAVTGFSILAMMAVPPLFGIFVAFILLLVGPIVCLAVPEETGAKGLIVGSVICQVVNLVASVVNAIAPGLIPPPLLMVLGLCGIAANVLFVLFMKKLSEYIGRLDLSARANNVLIGIGVLAGLFVVVFVAALGTGFAVAVAGPAAMGRGAAPAAAAGLGMACAMLVGGLALLIAGLVVFVLYVNLIDGLRKALRGA
jgi:hypothetical protein